MKQLRVEIDYTGLDVPVVLKVTTDSNGKVYVRWNGKPEWRAMDGQTIRETGEGIGVVIQSYLRELLDHTEFKQ